MQGLDFIPWKARDLYCNLSFSQHFQYTLLNSLQWIIMRVFVSICREHFLSAVSEWVHKLPLKFQSNNLENIADLKKKLIKQHVPIAGSRETLALFPVCSRTYPVTPCVYLHCCFSHLVYRSEMVQSGRDNMNIWHGTKMVGNNF